MEEPDNNTSVAGVEETEQPWWILILIYTRDWIHYGAFAFYVLLTLAAAIRGLLTQ